MSEKIICPHCGKAIDVDVNTTVAIIPHSEPEPEPTPEPNDNRMTFAELADIFSRVLDSCGYYRFNDTEDDGEHPKVYDYLAWVNMFADREFNDPDSPFFAPENYPDVFNYRGTDLSLIDTTYNAMQSWLMAMCLTELVADQGEDLNTQTQLFLRAWNLGGGSKIQLYGGYDLRGDPYAARLAAGRIYAMWHSAYSWGDFDDFRVELGGQKIQASNWDGLCFADHVLTDDIGRIGYKMDHLGFLINTTYFLQSCPGPRIDGTTAASLPMPYEQGQPADGFNTYTGNYKLDEVINDMAVVGWNCMAQTPLAEWEGYSREKKNRIINAMATIPCTYIYMFGKPIDVRLNLNGGELPIVDGYPRYVFEPADDGDLTIDGPFSDLAGIYRFNVPDSQKTATERFIETVLDIADMGNRFAIPNDPANIDGRNFLSGMDLDDVKKMAMQGTVLAHVDGGVHNMILEINEKSAFVLGELLYFFELACGVSAYMLGVNPFNQPGVEFYKRNMFQLLGKPGYES